MTSLPAHSPMPAANGVEARRWLPPERRTGLDRVADWPLHRRLVAIIALPVAATVVLAGFRVGGLLEAAADDSADAALSRAQRAAGDLAAAMGHEQVASAAQAVRAARPGRPDDPVPGGVADDLADDRAATEAAVTRLDQAMTGLVESGEPVATRARSVVAAVDRLAGIRDDLDAPGRRPTASLVALLREMTGVSGAAVRLGDALADDLAGDDVRQLGLTSQALAAGNRHQAAQDALVLVALSRWGEGAVGMAELRSAETARLASVSTYRDLATLDQRLALDAILAAEPAAARATALQDVAAAAGTGVTPRPELAPGHWSELAATTKAAADHLRRTRQDEQVDLAVAQRQDHLDRAAAEGVAAMVLLALGLAVTLLAARSILLPLRRLRADAIAIAEERLPAAIGRIRDAGPGGLDSGDIQVHPVDVRSSEEIGQVARAFDAVHVEAVRLAADQEQLRRNVNDLFVNLSR
ncbi:MAG: nitrate- and nitrite sensing domain-containing protein, partial [Kineosporiaceae bacterium]